MGKKPNIASTLTRVLSICVIGGSSLAAQASPSSALTGTFFDRLPEVAPAHSNAVLNQIFTTGSGTYDESTMKDRIFPYPLPVGGALGAPLYNGCYNRKSERIGNLDADNSCTSTIATHPNDSVYRLFLGYKISCLSGETTGTCSDAQLLLNCDFSPVHQGSGPFDRAQLSTRLCANTRGILRRAKGSSSTTPAFTGCRPGEDGSNYPSCTTCAPGTYNSHFDPNTVACTACGRNIPNADPAFPITWTSPAGSTSESACTVESGLVCLSGFHVTSDGQACDRDTSTCTLGMRMDHMSPTSSAATDGSLLVSVNGVQGALSQLSITAPSPQPGTGTNPKTFSGLSPGTYTVTARDGSCTLSNTYVLNALPPPAPSPTPTVGVKCVIQWCKPQPDGGSAYAPLTCYTNGTNSEPDWVPPMGGGGGSGSTGQGGLASCLSTSSPSDACATCSTPPELPANYLAGGRHTPTQCTAAGGTVVYENSLGSYLGTAGRLPGDVGFCRFDFPTAQDTNACPSEWTQYRYYRMTEGSYRPAAYVERTSDYGRTCDLPKYVSLLGRTVTQAGTFEYGDATPYQSAFMNGPPDSISVARGYYYDLVCSTSSAPPAVPPAFPPVGSLGPRFFDRVRDLDRMLDVLMPSAYAVQTCGNPANPDPFTCRETRIDGTLPLKTKQIGCF